MILSFCLTTYNKRELLEITLENYIANKKDGYELVVSDGGSTDGTVEYLQTLKNSGVIDSLILSKERDKGEWEGYKKTLQHAKGRYIYFLSDDDYFHFPAISKLLDYILANEDDIDYLIAEGYDYQYGNLIRLKYHQVMESVGSTNIQHSGMINGVCGLGLFIKTSVANTLNLFTDEYGMRTDKGVGLALFRSKYKGASTNIATYVGIKNEKSNSVLVDYNWELSEKSKNPDSFNTKNFTCDLDLYRHRYDVAKNTIKDTAGEIMIYEQCVKVKILVLGGFGFLGKTIAEVFRDGYYDLHFESRRTDCNLFNVEELKNKIKSINPDVIINAAANVGSINYVTEHAADVCHDNTLMYVNLYEAVKEVNPSIIVINPISNCSYPGHIDVQREDEWWNGAVHPSVESYGSSKKIGFILSEGYKKQYGITTVNLIIPNAYGPLDYADENKTHALNGLILRMIKAQRNGDTTFSIWGSGLPVREWIYMEDVARIMRIIVDEEMYDLPNPLNIGQEFGISIKESAETVKSMLNYNVLLSYDTSKQDGAPIKVLGKQKFDKLFPEFKFTPHDIGIKKTIDYYKYTL